MKILLPDLLLLYLQKIDRMTRHVTVSVGAILQLFSENTHQKTKETDRMTKYSCPPIFTISAAFVPYSLHSMQSTYLCSHFFHLLQIYHEQGLNAL
jgi:hypothetical protein